MNNSTRNKKGILTEVNELTENNTVSANDSVPTKTIDKEDNPESSNSDESDNCIILHMEDHKDMEDLLNIVLNTLDCY